MVALVFALIGLPLLIRATYMLVISAWAWRVPPSAQAGARVQRFVVVIPAHDEERVISGLVEDLMNQDYLDDRYDVWVIADRCTDATASVASAAGANVVERFAGEGGKGSVLAWFLNERPLAPTDALVVLDADNRVPENLFAVFADEIDDGHEVLQAYIDVTNPDESAFTLASALSYWSASRLVQLSRRNLGWSSQLGGTGMCITGLALDRAGGFGHSLTEDQDLELRVVESGGRVVWLHHLRVRDEKPPSVNVLTQQRARWATGKRTNRSVHASVLFRQSMGGSFTALDRFIELVFPSRILVFVLLAVVLSLATIVIGTPFWVIFAWVVLVADAVSVIASLIVEQVRPSWIAKAPLLVLFAIIWIPVQITSRRQIGWFSTPHGGSEADDAGDQAGRFAE